jgi:lysophospholipase L1-like esterase|nr:MAG TPA_asm: hydrolase [Caudoviricetes sp.]
MADTFKGIVTADGKKRQLPYGSILDLPSSDPSLTVDGGFADAAVVGKNFKKTNDDVASLKEDLAKQENRLEPIVKSNEDSKDAFYICDADGNIICKVDKDGVHSTGFDGKNLALNDVISTYEDSFYISDSDGNVIFMADKDGVRGLNMGASSGIDSPFKGMKLLTIGDSLSAHNKWQKWLVEWLGVTFDNDENINGKDGHKPMAKGGTAIAPTTEDSIYMRSLDAKYYADDTNGTVIIIYAGQNDSVTLGTIDDTPYTDKTVTSPSNLTFYSSYMGMIENILADIPFARIYLMTQMPVRLEIGMTGTADPYIGVIRFPDMTSVLAYEASRYKKVEAIRAISKKYSLPCIDLWEDSGINDYNSKYWYGAVGGTCGQVHPNNIGYKRMAEVAVAKMY